MATTNTGVTGVSNPCRVVAQPSQNIYWGDIHVMTGISAGLGRPAEAYAYARDESHLDFCAVTDGDKADACYADEEWDETRQAVREFYAPGTFVTLLGSEYHERKIAGDRNVYYPTDDRDLLRWNDLGENQPYVLWAALRGTRAITIPHHTTSGGFRFDVWAHHDPEFQRLVEIYSDWGNSECEGCLRPNYWLFNPHNSVRAGLNKGYRLGIVASGDSHDCLPGNSTWMRLRRGYHNGLVAVYADELTRETVFDALWNRCCYATTGTRIILDFHVNNAHMGQELTEASDRQTRTVKVQTTGTDKIAELVVVRNGEEMNRTNPDTAETALEWTDIDDFDAVALSGFDGRPFIYYYLRVTQTDGEIAWSSPVWVSGS